MLLEVNQVKQFSTMTVQFGWLPCQVFDAKPILLRGPFSKPEKGDFKCVNYNQLDLRTTIRLRLQFSLMVWMYKLSMPYRGNFKKPMEELTMPMEELTLHGEELVMPREMSKEVEEERRCADLALGWVMTSSD